MMASLGAFGVSGGITCGNINASPVQGQETDSNSGNASENFSIFSDLVDIFNQDINNASEGNQDVTGQAPPELLFTDPSGNINVQNVNTSLNGFVDQSATISAYVDNNCYAINTVYDPQQILTATSDFEKKKSTTTEWRNGLRSEINLASEEIKEVKREIEDLRKEVLEKQAILRHCVKVENPSEKFFSKFSALENVKGNLTTEERKLVDFTGSKRTSRKYNNQQQACLKLLKEYLTFVKDLLQCLKNECQKHQ